MNQSAPWCVLALNSIKQSSLTTDSLSGVEPGLKLPGSENPQDVPSWAVHIMFFFRLVAAHMLSAYVWLNRYLKFHFVELFFF